MSMDPIIQRYRRFTGTFMGGGRLEQTTRDAPARDDVSRGVVRHVDAVRHDRLRELALKTNIVPRKGNYI